MIYNSSNFKGVFQSKSGSITKKYLSCKLGQQLNTLHIFVNLHCEIVYYYYVNDHITQEYTN